MGREDGLKVVVVGWYKGPVSGRSVVVNGLLVFLITPTPLFPHHTGETTVRL